LSFVGKKCRFCDCRNANATCDWPIKRRGDVRIQDLRVGDIWIAQPPEQRGAIVEIEDFELTRRFWISTSGRQEPRPYDRFRGDLQLSERVERCGNACCYRHRRRIGRSRYYCSDHWRAWEAVS